LSRGLCSKVAAAEPLMRQLSMQWLKEGAASA
jgi:hypothetical protein